jgi:hypothetical protein
VWGKRSTYKKGDKMKKYAEKLFVMFAVFSTAGITFLWVIIMNAVAHAMGVKLDEVGGLVGNLVSFLALAVPMAYFMFLLVIVDKKVTEWIEK